MRLSPSESTFATANRTGRIRAEYKGRLRAFVVSDDHAGLRQAIIEVLPKAAWQRCYVYFLRNALDCVPRKVDDDCLLELRWLEPVLGRPAADPGTGAISPRPGATSRPG